MILINIGFGLMTAAALTLWIFNRRLSGELRREREEIKFLDGMTTDLMGFKTGTDICHMLKAEVEEFCPPETALPYFAVTRRIDRNHTLCISKIYYNPADPDDRDYKRIHAEEIAEKLNEKP